MKVMLKRRNIRETAIQFLYLADLEDGPEASDMQEAFWQMTQESNLRKLSQAKTKAILHVAQGRDNRLSSLMDRATSILAEIKASVGNGEDKQLVPSLNSILSQEKKLSKEIESLKSATQNKRDEPVPEKKIQAVLDANRSLSGLRATWYQALDDFPSLRNKLEPVTSAINHLERVSERIDAIEDPDSTVGDFAHLRASSAELSALRTETQALVKNILNHKEQIDSSLAGVIENYSPERIDPVDRAILRLATFEIQNSDDIPRAVSINEAIEIAKKFGTQESARFVNGVLDAL